jgi:UDP-N-acetylmuramoyl-L-alanyl-D-glutamate--2,6-diaminopimelate ligase
MLDCKYELLALLDELRVIAPAANLRSDSRQVENGDIFFAFPVAKNAGDGRQYIQAAISNGAAAVVYDADNFVWNDEQKVPHFPVTALSSELGVIANTWYGHPDQEMFTVAVTGTNGKTSCSQWIAAAFSHLAVPCGVIGTLGCGVYQNGQLEHLSETGFTTPDALQLQSNLQSMQEQGAKALAIEASSIGLQQQRLNGLHIDVAVFTNLTRDHLDYHGSFENYATAKVLLFERSELKIAIINLDDVFGEELVQRLLARQEVKVIGYSLLHKTHPTVPVIFADQIRHQVAGTQFQVSSPFGYGNIKTKMIGEFNVSNVLGVLGVLLASDITWQIAAETISLLNPVAGRMQQLGSPNQVMIVIDYAHTPDALEKTLTTLKAVSQERRGALWCVFGCGGDRDTGKRPQMGRIAELAQHVVVTSDNPRSENPGGIIRQIIEGMKTTPQVIEDRANAILYAIKHAKAQDIVLIAGKGHENYQEINGKKWPFSDHSHAELALAAVAVSGGHAGLAARGEH